MPKYTVTGPAPPTLPGYPFIGPGGNPAPNPNPGGRPPGKEPASPGKPGKPNPDIISTRDRPENIRFPYGSKPPKEPPAEPELDDPRTEPSSQYINAIAPPSQREVYGNLIGIDDTVPLAYGATWVAAKPWVAAKSDDDGAKLFVAYVVAEGEMDDVTRVDMDDHGYGPSGATNERPFATNWTLYMGAAAQDVSADFATHIPGYGDAHAGLTLIAGAVRADQLDGLPTMRVKGQWRKLFDPRVFNSMQVNSSGNWRTGDASALKPSANITVECWGYLYTTPTGDAQLFGKFSGSSGYRLKFNAGQVQGQLNVGGVLRTISCPTSVFAVASLDKAHVAMTYSNSGSRLRLYVNGARVAETTVSGTITHTTGDLEVGGSSSGYRVTDARLWNVERTADEVFAAYRDRLEGTETGLVAYYPVDDAVAAGTVVDKTGNGYDMTPVGLGASVVDDHVVGLTPASWCTRAWSDNAGLVVGDIAQLAADESAFPMVVNWDDVATVAEHCDQTVTGGAKRGTFSGVLDGAQPWQDWLTYVAPHGFLVWWQDGDEVRFKADWSTAVNDHTIDEADIWEGTFSWSNGDPGYEEQPDRVAVRYIDSTTNEEATAYDAAPTGNERFTDFQRLDGIATHGHARRRAIRVKEGYELTPVRFQMDVTDVGALIEKWDVVLLNITRLGLSERCRVLETPELIEPGRYRLQLRLYDGNLYNTSNDAASGLTLSTIPTGQVIPAGPQPTNITADGVASNLTRLTVRIQEPDWPHTASILYEVRDATNSYLVAPVQELPIGAHDQFAAGPPRVLEAEVYANGPPDNYYVRCAIRSSSGAVGAWGSAWLVLSVILNAPAAVTSLGAKNVEPQNSTILKGAARVQVSWVVADTLNWAGYFLRVYRCAVFEEHVALGSPAAVPTTLDVEQYDAGSANSITVDLEVREAAEFVSLYVVPYAFDGTTEGTPQVVPNAPGLLTITNPGERGRLESTATLTTPTNGSFSAGTPASGLIPVTFTLYPKNDAWVGIYINVHDSDAGGTLGGIIRRLWVSLTELTAAYGASYENHWGISMVGWEPFSQTVARNIIEVSGSYRRFSYVLVGPGGQESQAYTMSGTLSM